MGLNLPDYGRVTVRVEPSGAILVEHRMVTVKPQEGEAPEDFVQRVAREFRQTGPCSITLVVQAGHVQYAIVRLD